MANTPKTMSVTDFVDHLYAVVENYETKMQKRKFKTWFKNLWEANADEYQFFELAQSMKPGITWETFDKGWQYRTVLHEDYKYAQTEFVQILLGWW